MRFRDIKHYLLVLLALSALDLAAALTGIRDPKPSDYDRSCIIAAFAAVLWAIREKEQPDQ